MDPWGIPEKKTLEYFNKESFLTLCFSFVLDLFYTQVFSFTTNKSWLIELT